MLSVPDILALPMLVTLAAAPGGDRLACALPKAPHVTVKVATNDIKYDFSRSSQELTMMKGDTLSPYAPGTDMASGGLREDRPTINTQIEWQIELDERRNVACMWYDKVTIRITLDPKIYVAREFNTGTCREAVLRHEHRHVDIDRIVLNKFAADIGQAVQQAVDSAGVFGPFNYNDVERVKDKTSRHIESAIDTRRLLMEKDMDAQQSRVDSLEEYERVSAQCRDVRVRK